MAQIQGLKPAALPDEKNDLQNPGLDFDGDFDGVADDWAKSGSVNATHSFEVENGKGQKIIVTASITGALVHVEQKVGVTANETYSLSVDGKVENAVGGFRGRIYIAWHDAADAVISYTTAVPFTNTGYSRIKQEGVQAPPNAVKARVILQAEAQAAGDRGTVWFRRAKFEKGPKSTYYPTDAPNLIETNPLLTVDSDEDGVTDEWNITNTTTGNKVRLEVSEEKGQGIFVEDSTEAGYHGIQNASFPVVAGETYTLSVDIFCEQTSGNPGMLLAHRQVSFYAKDGAFITGYGSDTTANERRSFYMTAPSNATTAMVVLRARIKEPGTAGVVWYKNVQLEAGTEPTPFRVSHVKKMGFENMINFPSLNRDSDGDGVVDGWTSGTSPGISAEFFFDSEAQIINLTESTAANYAWITQSVPVVAGKYYTLSAYTMGIPVEGAKDFRGRIALYFYKSDGTYITGSGWINSRTSWGSPAIFHRQILRNIQAPTGAATVRVEMQAYAGAIGDRGTLMFKKVQLQEGDTATEYEENDFFTRVDQLFDSGARANAWERTSNGKETGIYGYGVKELPANRQAISAFGFTVPVDAKNIRYSVWGDFRSVPQDSNFTLSVNDMSSEEGYWLLGNAPPIYFTVEGIPGDSALIFSYFQGSTPGSPYLDNLTIIWDEEEAPPSLVLPKTKKVHVLDFETEELGDTDFFEVHSTARGYDYGFTRSKRRKRSGRWSFGVADVVVKETDTKTGRLVPPNIPPDSSAACMIRIPVPVTAMNPRLSFSYMYDALDEYFGIVTDLGRVVLDGEEIYVSTNREGWMDFEFDLSPGVTHTLLIEYTTIDSEAIGGTDSVYLDNVVVSYDIPNRPYMYIATQQETELRLGQTETQTFKESFETTNWTGNKFFKFTNPGKLVSGGGPSQYPEAGWVRTNTISRIGSYCLRAQREKLKKGEDAGVDVTFTVPYGVKNPTFKWWNFVELKREYMPPKNEKYFKSLEEYRIWINNSLWKQFSYTSPAITSPVKYTGAYPVGDASNDWVCPWGRWWQESYALVPGKTYTFSFELQKDSGPDKINGRNLCAIDEMVVSWEETSGDIVTIPPEALVYLDDRDGYRWFGAERGGAEMAPLSFAEYQVYGDPGAVYQFTKVDPRVVDFPIRVKADGREELRQKMRDLTSQIANRPLSLVTVYPEGEQRILNCRFEADQWREDQGSLGTRHRRVNLTFRAFDPFWYGPPQVTDEEGDKRWVKIDNTGDVELWPFIKIYGPVTNPIIRLTSTPPPDQDFKTLKQIKLNFNLLADRYIVIDTRPGKKSVLLNDGTNLYQYLDNPVSELFSVPKGTHGLKLEGSGTNTNTKIVAEYQVPYWGV